MNRKKTLFVNQKNIRNLFFVVTVIPKQQSLQVKNYKIRNFQDFFLS